ncbi:MAG: TRAP transporter small permease subunit [Rhizobiaceae bacterium]
MTQDFLTAFRRLNGVVAILVGALLLVCAAFVLLDILLRQVGSSFGGTDEISGYVMAIATSWGMAFALLELGHVRIDLLRSRFTTKGRVLIDLGSMLVLNGTVTLIAVQCWPVVATSVANGSTANTSLETPLALVQIPWLAGWMWFALMGWLTFVGAVLLVSQGRFDATEKAIGAFADQDALL